MLRPVSFVGARETLASRTNSVTCKAEVARLLWAEATWREDIDGMQEYPTHKETRLKGLPVSEGFAVARVCLFNDRRHNVLPVYRVRDEMIPAEIERVEKAIGVAGERLDELREKVARQVGSAEAEIFVAQKLILTDRTLRKRMVEVIQEKHLNAEQAVSQVLDEFETRLLSVDDQYMRERASDFGEIKRRLLDVFGNLRPDLQCSSGGLCQRGKNRIVVAEELTPALTVDLDMQRLMGLVTERGGRNSHGAILARSLGIPAVSGLRGFRSAIGCGTEILVNGTTGEVVVWPADATVQAATAAHPRSMREATPHDPVEGFKVMANIGVSSDISEAVRMKAEGVGLYRTEMDLIAAKRMLTEQELFDRYQVAAEALAGRPVLFRLFDIGSDKKPAFVSLPGEDNPQLGWRGSRFLLGNPELFRLQARALARLSKAAAVDVMYPMVSGVEQFRRLKAAFLEAVSGFAVGKIRHGVMLEVPSACLDAVALLGEADFGSVGTNDLTQYLLAVDRDNEMVADEFSYDTPALWRLLREVAAAGRETGKDVSVCGEMAGDPAYVGRLMETGIRSVSVSARRIPVVRAAATVLMQSAGKQG